MEKITKGHPLTQSTDIVKENLETLKRLFPTIVKEGKIDVDELKALLDEEVETNEEYYRFTWAGKSEARREANKPSTATLRPNKADSKNWDTTGNIFIEGDNLEVLKLLQKSYAGKIKMMYFDPPYNTGKDFVYKDNYKDNLGNYLAITGQTDEKGKKLNTNTESDGRFHSNWLNMMYPRLKLARNLLTEDGVVFASIDDNEVHNLRKLFDEVFGEENFVGQWNWFKSATPPNLSKKIKKNIEYILCYQKAKNDIKFKGIRKISSSDDPITKPQNTIKELKFPVGSITISNIKDSVIESGIYGTDKYPNELLNDLIIENSTNKNEVIFKNKFVWTQPKLIEELENNTTINLSKSLVISYKKADYGEEVPPNIIDENVNVTTTENAGRALEKVFDNIKIFDYPKPVDLIEYLINFVCDDNDLILDFFAGSGTTANSILNLNSRDGGKRKFILIQLDELLDENNANSEASRQIIKNAIYFLNGLNKSTNVAEITKERIRRVSEKILSNKILELDSLEKSIQGKILQDEVQEQIDSLKHTINNLDTGFKAFKLDSSNINAWDGSVGNFETNLFNAQHNVLS